MRGEGGYKAPKTPKPRKGPEPIPGPDDPELYDDIGELVPDDAAPTPIAPGAAAPADTARATSDAGPAAPDPPPAHGGRDWHRSPKAARGKAPRVTATIRTDIDAKISFALEIPGRIWQARDPVCGTMFVQQRPDISGALTEIVCQSPDLIAWFTGAGGQFMLWMNLAAACWPIATVVMAHHVYHTVELAEGEPAAQNYAA